MIVIDKNIPVPAKGTRTSKYPFAQMTVGDSFASQAKSGSMYQSASKWGKANNAKFVVRPEGNGSRVWRVA